jgi:hypothetical protein
MMIMKAARLTMGSSHLALAAALMIAAGTSVQAEPKTNLLH